jgi:predicted XRE-type DNA-binding protein
MSKKPEKTVIRGTENIFADIGQPDADTHLLKARLVSRIQDVIAEGKLTQIEAGKRMGISQPDVSRLLSGQFRDVSVERLMRLLTKLGCNVDIVIRNPGRNAKPQDTIHLQGAPV